jgi:hypothetical protein
VWSDNRDRDLGRACFLLLQGWRVSRAWRNTWHRGIPGHGLRTDQLESYESLTSSLDRSEWSVSRPFHFTSRGRAHGTYWIGEWGGSRADVDDIEQWKFLSLPRLEKADG